MSWQARVVSSIIRRRIKNPQQAEDSIDKIRARFNYPLPTPVPRRWRRVAGQLSPGPASGTVTSALPPVTDAPSTYMASVGGEWLLPPGSAQPGSARWISEVDAPTILYLHGGGYCFCSVTTHRPLVKALALATRMRIFTLEYRLAPEHPFPAAIEDALMAYRALLDLGISPGRIAVAGDSAGGGLTLAMTIVARELGWPMPGALYLLSPWTDLAATGESLVSNSQTDAMFSGGVDNGSSRRYLGDVPPTNPLASPLYADLHGLPPICVQASNSEVLRDDATRLADRASAAGVLVDVRLWEDMPHVWQLYAPYVPEAQAAINAAGVFLRQYVSPAPSSRSTFRRALPRSFLQTTYGRMLTNDKTANPMKIAPDARLIQWMT